MILLIMTIFDVLPLIFIVFMPVTNEFNLIIFVDSCSNFMMFSFSLLSVVKHYDFCSMCSLVIVCVGVSIIGSGKLVVSLNLPSYSHISA